MAKFRKWTVKNVDQKKQYKTAMGTTDYDIPMFGYKSVLLIIAAMVMKWWYIKIPLSERKAIVNYSGEEEEQL